MHVVQAGLAGFCRKVEKTVFFRVKTGLAKIVFAGKIGFCRQKAKTYFCQNCHQSKLLLYYVFSMYLF